MAFKCDCDDYVHEDDVERHIKHCLMIRRSKPDHVIAEQEAQLRRNMRHVPNPPWPLLPFSAMPDMEDDLPERDVVDAAVRFYYMCMNWHRDEFKTPYECYMYAPRLLDRMEQIGLEVIASV